MTMATTSTFTQLLSSEIASQVQCCFTSTETIRNGEPRTAIPGLSLQLLSSGGEVYVGGGIIRR